MSADAYPRVPHMTRGEVVEAYRKAGLAPDNPLKRAAVVRHLHQLRDDLPESYRGRVNADITWESRQQRLDEWRAAFRAYDRSLTNGNA